MPHFTPTPIQPPAELSFDGYAHSRTPRLLLAADGSIDVRGTLDLLLVATPGPQVMAVAARLNALDVVELTDADRVDLTLVFERCDSWLQAQKQTPLAALGRAAGRKSTTPGMYEDIGLELALALRWSEGVAHARMRTARIFDERLPQTAAALAGGEISLTQALMLNRGAQVLDHPDADDPVAAAAELERRVLPKAPEQRWAETDKAVTRAVMGIDPEAVEARRKKTRTERGVFKGGGPRNLFDRLEGRGSLFAQGPAEDVDLIDTALRFGAEQLVATGQTDTIPQGMFDTLRSWASDSLRDGAMPTRSARPAHVTVITKETTLSGEDDDPGELVGYGPITAAAVRDIAFGVPPRPGPFSDPSCAVDAETRNEDRLTRLQESDGYYDTYGRDPDDDSEPDEDDPPDDDPAPDDGGGPGTGGRGGGGPPPRAGPEPGSSSDTAPTQPTPPVRIRTLRIDPDTGFALPRDGLRLDYGTIRRVWPSEVIDHLRDKYRVCSFPGCNARAGTLDGDHWTPRSNGGPTDATTNAGPACPHHNRITRNRPGWQITPNGDGTATLTTPHGRDYPITPYDYRDL